MASSLQLSGETGSERLLLLRFGTFAAESCIMLGRIIEIEGEGRRLSLDRGFMAVSGPDGLLGKVPLDDIEAVILSNPATSFTSQIVSALAYRGTPFVICNGNFQPSAYILPVDGHHAQGDRIAIEKLADLHLS